MLAHRLCQALKKGQKARVLDEISYLFFLMVATNVHLKKITENPKRTTTTPTVTPFWSVWQSDTPGSWGDHDINCIYWMLTACQDARRYSKSISGLNPFYPHHPTQRVFS